MKCKRRVFDPSVCLVPLVSAHCVNISRAWNLFENLVAFGDCWFIKLLTDADRMSCTRDPILATLFLLGHAPLAVANANYFESVEHGRRRAVPFRLCRLCNTRRVLVAISMACRLLFRL